MKTAGADRIVAVVPADAVVYAPGFERDLEQPIAASIAVDPSAVLVVTEGNYLLLDEPPWTQVRGAMDEVWFCDADEARRMRQLVARHVAFGKAPAAAAAWAAGPDERNAELVRRTGVHADLVVPESTLLVLGTIPPVTHTDALTDSTR